MKTSLENKKFQETLRQREAEVLTQIIKKRPDLSRLAEERLVALFRPELTSWSKKMAFQNSGRSSGLCFVDYLSAAYLGFDKAAHDYNPAFKTAFKTWLGWNAPGKCNDLAKKNGKIMKKEVGISYCTELAKGKESKMKEIKDDSNTATETEEPQTISIDNLVGDDRFAPEDQHCAPWVKYRETYLFAARAKAIFREKANQSEGTTQKKAQRVQKFLKHVEDGGDKLSFSKKTGCSRTTLDNNLDFFINGNTELREMKKSLTRHHKNAGKKSKE